MANDTMTSRRHRTARTFFAATCGAALFAGVGHAHASPFVNAIFDFHYNDTAGTNFSTAADSSGNAYGWGNNLNDTTTDGAGTLVVDNTNSSVTRSIELAAEHQINATQNSIARLTLVFTPWNFASSNSGEELQFGFGSSSPTNITAQATLIRTGDDEISLRTSALGAGATQAGAQVVFSAVETSPVTLIIELNKFDDTYTVLYARGDADATVFYTGDVAPDRGGNHIRFTLRNQLGVDNTVGTDQLSLFTIPEPASLSLLGLGGALLTLRRRPA